jgi:hypothetical protein
LLKAAETMTSKRILSLAVAVTGALLLLVSCGGHDGVELGDFPVINKTEGEFELTAPSSKSPAPFTFSSSDPAVASISAPRSPSAWQAPPRSRPSETGQLLPDLEEHDADRRQAPVRRAGSPGKRRVRDAAGDCLLRQRRSAVLDADLVRQDHGRRQRRTAGADFTGWRLPTQFELTTLALSAELGEREGMDHA